MTTDTMVKSAKGGYTSVVASGGAVSSIGIIGSTGLSVSGSPVTSSGDITLTLGTELQALSLLSTTGLVTRTAANTYIQRSIAVGSARLTLANGSGVSGNPTLDLSDTAVTPGSYVFGSFSVTQDGRITSASSGAPVTSISVTGSTGLVVGGSPITTTGTITLTLGSELQALSALSTTGFISRTGSNTYVTGSITATGSTGLVVGGSPLSSPGTFTFTLGSELQALSALSTTGIVTRTAANTYVQRSIAVGSANLTVSNGSGVSGDPTLDLALVLTGLTSIAVGNLSLSGNTLSTTNSNGDLILLPNGTGGVSLKGAASIPLKFYNSAATFFTALKSGTLSASTTFTLPVADGGSGQALKTDGSAALGWVTLTTGTVTSVAVTGSTGLVVGGSPITSSGTITLTLGSELQALSALSTTGLVTRTAANTYVQRSVAVGSANLTVSNGSGVSGNPTLDLATTLTGLVSVTSTTLVGGNISLAANTLTIANTNGGLIIAPNGTGNVQLKNGTNAVPLLFYNSAGTFFIALKAGTLAASTTFVLPTADGTSNQFLSTDASANLSFATAISSFTVAGSTGLTVGGSPVNTNSSGAVTLTLGTQLQGLSAISANGLITRTASGTYTSRSIAVGSANLTVSNGDGVSGNPTLDLGLTLTGLTSIALGNLSLSGNTLSTTNSNGDLILLPNGTGGVSLKGSASIPLKFFNSAGTFFTALKAATLVASTTFTLPTADGGSGQALKTDGSAALGWVTLTTGTVTSVAVTGSTGLVVGGSPITSSGTITLTLGSELQALSALSTTGLVTRTAANTYVQRSVAVGSANLTVSNGNGVSANPTLDLATTITGLTSVSSTTITGGNISISSDTISNTVATNALILAPTTSGVVQLKNSTNAIPLQFFNSAGTFFSAFKAGTLVASTTWTLPTADSTGTQFLQSNGSGVLSFATGNAGTVTSVAATGSTGLTIGGSPITTSGTITFTLGTQLQGLSAISANGLTTRTASGTYTSRSIAVGSANLTVSNGDGVSGNPTLDLATTLTGLTSVTSTTLVAGNISLAANTLTITNANAGLIIAPNGTGNVQLKNGTNAVPLLFFNSAGTFFTGFKAGTLVASTTFTLPTADGGAGQALKTDGSAALGWVTLTTGTVTSVAATGSTGLVVGGSPITSSGTITLTLGSELQALSGLSTTGLVTRTAANTYSQRSIAVGSANLTVANADGVSANPTLDLALALTGLTSGVFSNIGIASLQSNTISVTNANASLRVSPNGTGAVQIRNGTNAVPIRWFNAAATQSIGLKAGTVAASIDFTLPSVDGTNGQFLSTDGALNLSFLDPYVSGTNLIVVDKGGSDSTGSRGGLPFLTIGSALAASGIAAGDTVVVYPGTYTESALSIPDAVSLVGVGLPIISSTSTSITLVTIGAGSLFSNFFITMSGTAATVAATAVDFAPTVASPTGFFSTMQNVSASLVYAGGGTSGNVTCIKFTTSASNSIVQDCDFTASCPSLTTGTVSGILTSGGCAPSIRNCLITATTGGGASGYGIKTATSGNVLMYSGSLSATTTLENTSGGGTSNLINVNTSLNGGAVNIRTDYSSTIGQSTGTLATLGNFTTSPTATNSIAGSAVTLATPFQNTLGYDAVWLILVKLLAGTGTLLSGVASSATPTKQTVMASTTFAATTIIPITLYIPSNYYGSVDTTGFIGATISGQSVMAV